MSTGFKYQVPGYLIIGLVLFFCYKFGVPYIQNERLENRVQKLVNYNKDVYSEPVDQWEVRDQIHFNARKLGIKLSDDQVSVETIDRDLNVQIRYVRVVDLFFKKVPMHFEILARTNI